MISGRSPFVRGMNIDGSEGNEVLAMDVARDDQELLVVTEGTVTVRSAGRSIDVPAGSGLWMAASDPGVVVAAHSPAAEFFRTLVGGH